MTPNPSGNSYPEGVPRYKVTIIKDGGWFAIGAVIEVMDSLNPSFTNHWRITDSQFIPKHLCSEPL